jgi:hypothetical protein
VATITYKLLEEPGQALGSAVIRCLKRSRSQTA